MIISKSRINEIKMLLEQYSTVLLQNTTENTKFFITCNDNKAILQTSTVKKRVWKYLFVIPDINATLGWDGTFQDELDDYLDFLAFKLKEKNRDLIF